VCRKTFITSYTNLAYHATTNQKIVSLIKERCGVRSISRLLGISVTTIQRRKLKISAQIKRPPIQFGKEYEVDELCTFLGYKKKRLWVVYALRRGDNEVVDLRVGSRSNKTFKPLIETLLLSNAKKIYTDGLKNYRCLIPYSIHKVSRFGTNHIERMNLNLRTHLKCLTRRTICFNRSQAMLIACLRIYFWGGVSRLPV
jgi:insertion element IS1 protein InsB